ncbi:MAG: hypothetical protein RL095_4145 [Verrucomicrobiota bacterium]|jgi:Ser/Thr protein kinase RdoA (MazF antagonist)
MTTSPDLQDLASRFQIAGDYVRAEAYGSGHINDTFCLHFLQGGQARRYILQRINHLVFKDPEAVTANIDRVTRHISAQVAHLPDAARRVLKPIPARDGRDLCSAGGNFWRCYDFIAGARCYDEIESHAQAYAAARAFGLFQKQLADLPGRLIETIPGFHNTRRRFDNLVDAIRLDPLGRAGAVEEAIDFCLQREGIVDLLLEGQRKGLLPERNTHNDTKLNNVLIDDLSGEGICVIDLDTVMPGLSLYDFGDMCRSACRPCAEDETELSKVVCDLDMFEALVRGYLDSARDFLVEAEIDLLAFSARLITFEIGVRFLEDHLRGDVYYRIHHPGHNLERALVQFQLVRSFEENQAAMESIVAAARRPTH